MGRGPAAARGAARGADAAATLAPDPVADAEIVLLPHRAAYWPEARTLLVADLHLGKGETFRAAGVPVPHAVHDEALARLSAAIACSEATRVLILGDLLHAPAGQTETMLDSVAAWRRRETVRIAVVPGNHDRGLAAPAAAWGVEVLPPVYAEGPFVFTHEPAAHDGAYVWCGHLHPALPLDRGRYAPKLPCFHLGPRTGVLPAFTRFAAGGPVRRGPGDRVFAIADGQVLPV